MNVAVTKEGIEGGRGGGGTQPRASGRTKNEKNRSIVCKTGREMLSRVPGLRTMSTGDPRRMLMGGEHLTTERPRWDVPSVFVSCQLVVRQNPCHKNWQHTMQLKRGAQPSLKHTRERERIGGERDRRRER